MSERDITQSTLSTPPLTLWRDEQLRAPTTSPPASWARRASEALIALSLMWLVLCLADPSLALSAQVTLGGWGALSLSFGLLWVGVTARALSLHRSAVMGGARALGASGPYDRGLTSRGVSAWVASAALTALYCGLYWWPSTLEGWVMLSNPLAYALTGAQADQWFLYSALYSGAVLSFGVRSALKGRGHPYVLARTLSVCLSQLGLAFLVPYFLKAQGAPEFYPSYFWPLKPDYLLPFDYITHEQSGLIAAEWSGRAVGRAMLLWAALMSFIFTPLLTYRFGKRWYCAWVCGCGALAETAGDPWRHLAAKGQDALTLERWLSWLILLVISGFTLFLWVNEWSGRALLGSDGSHLFWRTYGLLIVMSFSGVIGVGLYPLLGSRSWCRFGCPQAKILGLLQVLFKRFKIKTEGESCVSCGRCTHACEMGIDVRAYAQRGEVIIREACVGCGACEEACPRGVIKLTSK